MCEEVRVDIYGGMESSTDLQRYDRFYQTLDFFISTKSFRNTDTMKWFEINNIPFRITYSAKDNSSAILFDNEEHATLFRIQFGDCFFVRT